jgi:peroxiredoxin
MALTYSPSPDQTFQCPDFQLGSVDQKNFSREDFSAAQVLVVMFICNHCPYVKAVEDRLLDLSKELTPKGAAFVGICSNDPSDYPEDEPAQLFHRWRAKAYPFPYLIDASQKAAKSFGAVCTPDIFVFDKTRALRYRGRIDDSWRNPALVQKRELKAAIEALLAGKSVPADQVPSMGCSIKWLDQTK